jgi:hypothetical protein
MKKGNGHKDIHCLFASHFTNCQLKNIAQNEAWHRNVLHWDLHTKLKKTKFIVNILKAPTNEATNHKVTQPKHNSKLTKKC